MKSRLRIEWMPGGALMLAAASLSAGADLQVARIAPMSGPIESFRIVASQTEFA